MLDIETNDRETANGFTTLCEKQDELEDLLKEPGDTEPEDFLTQVRAAAQSVFTAAEALTVADFEDEYEESDE